MIYYHMRRTHTYIYTMTRTYWHQHGSIIWNWESRMPQDRDRGHVSNVPDTLVNMMFGLPEDLKR